MIKSAVFFRNVNLGRPGSPSRAQLERAFLDAGAAHARSFLTNGTLVFAAGPGLEPCDILAVAAEQLRGACGLVEPGFLRPVAYLRGLVALDPFASVDRGSVYRCNATFLSDGVGALPAVPLESRRRDVEVLRVTGGEALGVSRKVGNTPGSPNAFLERLLGRPATTRHWNTVVRLVRKYA